MAAIEPGLRTLAFAVDKGFDKIPEKAFSTPKEKKEWERQEREKARQNDREQQEQEREPRRSPPRHRRSLDDDRFPASPNRPRAAAAGAAAGAAATASFQPPPPPVGSHSGQNYSPFDAQPPRGYIQDPYAQDDGFQRPGRQSFSPSGRYDDFNSSDPRLTQKRSNTMQSDRYQPPSSDTRRSYNPSDYQPRDGADDDRVGYRRENASSYGDPYAGRAASAGPRGDRYSSRYDDYDDDDRSDRRDRKPRKHHDSRSSSEEGIRGKIGGRFDKTEHGLATGALGALAGGVLGHEVGKGKGVWPTVAGVIIGGLGANAIEARHEKKKHAREEERHRTRSVDGGKQAFRSYEDDYDDYQDRRSSRRSVDYRDERDPEYDDRRSGYARSTDRYDRYDR